jgi:hypothetical protein
VFVAILVIWVVIVQNDSKVEIGAVAMDLLAVLQRSATPTATSTVSCPVVKMVLHSVLRLALVATHHHHQLKMV